MDTHEHEPRGTRRVARLRAAVPALAVATALAAGGTSTAGAAGGDSFPTGAGGNWAARMSPSNFVRNVDHPFFPLVPGTRYRYRGVDEGTPIVDAFRVTHREKEILGVKATVVHDQVLIDGKPREVTNDWYAQDRRGNVWYFGERTMTLNRHGYVTSREGSFKAGRDGARPGIYLNARPKRGDQARQEYYKGHAEDRYKVVGKHTSISVPYVSSDHALRTREVSPLEKGVVDNKYYVRGIGTVLEAAVKGPVERLELVSVKRR
jgi:hypothetical protein